MQGRLMNCAVGVWRGLWAETEPRYTVGKGQPIAADGLNAATTNERGNCTKEDAANDQEFRKPNKPTDGKKEEKNTDEQTHALSRGLEGHT